VDDELAEFVRARYQQLLRRAYLLTGSQPAAEDLVQEALARCCAAWRRRPVAEPDAYVQRVMLNLLVSRSRLRRFREDATETLPERGVADATAEHADRDVMWRVLQEAAPRQRAVLVLRFYEDLTEAQIAECLNVTVGTVRSQTAKGLARLRLVATRAINTEDLQ
jgi:RNA polymerase sigma-70 factor (sigma-E family)